MLEGQEGCGESDWTNEWGDCVDHAKVEIPISTIKLEEVEIAVKHMKSGKASGPTDVVVEMLEAEGKGFLKPMTRRWCLKISYQTTEC